MSPLETHLRELCAAFEWTEPPNMEVAQLCQDMADRLGDIDPTIAATTVEVLAPVAWAQQELTEEDIRERVLQHAVTDLSRWLEEAPEQDKPRIRARLLEQERILGGHDDRCC